MIRQLLTAIVTFSMLLSPLSASAATTFLDPGGDSAFGVASASGGLWDSTAGTAPTIVTDFVHGGHLRSIKYATAAASGAQKMGVLADAGSRFSFYIYISALPTATTRIFGLYQSDGVTLVAQAKVTSAGVLQLFETTAQIGTNGPTLSTGTWYRISLAYTINSTTVNRFELFKDGVSAISVTNATLTNTGTNAIRPGVTSDTTFSMRSSDHYVDNSSSLTDTGDIWVTAKRPVSNGSANAFITRVGAGGSGYGSGHTPQVNERAFSATNAWSLSNTAVATEEYTIEGKSVGDIDISSATIVDYMGWIDSKVDSISNSPVHHIIVGGVATAITQTLATNAIFIKIAGSATYPSGNTDIGIDAQYTSVAHTTTLNEAGIVVAYTPAGPSTGFISGLRWIIQWLW